MSDFPRTEVGGVSMPRIIIGTNWFRGFSHTSKAKDCFIKDLQTGKRVAEILKVFLANGIDAVMGGNMNGPMQEALDIAEQAVGRKIIRIITPHFNIREGGPADMEPEAVFTRCKEMGATFCMPHQAITDALMDKRARVIRDLPVYTRMIRDLGMLPGLSTHVPETIKYADEQDEDIETYIQILNAAGFLMQIEADWVINAIQNARHPVMCIKPLAAGRLMPPVGLAFVWQVIRDCDMVAIGCTTPHEAAEVIEISRAYLENRHPDVELQWTRSKKSLTD